MAGIVVGVDGSDQSRRALGWAMREAAAHQLPLTVLTVRPDPVRPATRIFWGIAALPQDPMDADLALMAVRDLVDKVASQVEVSVPEVTVAVATGNAAQELVRASRDADLIVVGCGGSAAAGLLAGSVSGRLAHSASCPVVVVPAAG